MQKIHNNKISDIFPDGKGIAQINNIAEDVTYGIESTKRNSKKISTETTMFANIITKFRKMQEGKVREQNYIGMALDNKEKDVLRIIFSRLGLFKNEEIQFFSTFKQEGI